MNNIGALSIRQVFLFIAIMCLCILVTMIMYNKTVKDIFGGTEMNGLTYKDTEEKVTKAAQDYVFNNRKNDLKNGDRDYVTIETLQNEGILDIVIDPKDNNVTCTGYVSLKMQNNEITYDPYIKCGPNYHTKGYNANYDA